MLNALTVALRGSDADGAARAAASMQRQGFVHAARYAWDGGVLDAWSNPGQVAIENCELGTPMGTAYCVGPLWYRGRFGRTALPMVMADIESRGALDELELRGNFALFVHTPTRCLLMNDALGFVRINRSAGGLFHSTSWLATCAYAGSVELDEDAAIEYVLLGASHSDATVARDITSLPLAHAFDLHARMARARLSPGFWTDAPVPQSFDAAVEQLSAHLLRVFREAGAAFSGKVRAALSGGFDSRLILAGLLATGTRPDLFVYGAAGSSDVRIAQAVAAGAALPIKAIDKREIERSLPEVDLDHLVQTALFFDGLPNDGIGDRGSDRQTRLAQTADGYLAINGGGGEIFRNFFHLPDRPLHAIDVVRSFYRGFDAKVFRRTGALRDYEARMVASMQRVLGLGDAQSGKRLTRAQVELLYPLFRCHHWMGVNNSVAVRHGAYATPLVDLHAARIAAQISLAWKNAGQLEARLIAGLHRGVAGEISSYGFSFSDGPSARARRAERATCLRPPWLRPTINAVRRRLHATGPDARIVTRFRTLLPGEWRLDSLLDLARLPDTGAFARALAVEVVWREVLR